MKARLTSVTLLTSDVKASTRFYQESLGMQPELQHHGLGDLNRVCLLDGVGPGDLLLCLQGPPFSPWAQARYSRRGPHISQLNYLVDDLDGWRARLQAYTPKIALLPAGEREGEALCFEDDTGIVVCLVPCEAGPSTSRPSAPSPPETGIRCALHHTAILCQDDRAKTNFYRQVLGMEPVYEIREDAIAFLGDASLGDTPGRSGPMLEVMGAAGHWPREQAMMSRYGSCLDHLSFLAEDVNGACERLRALGIQFEIEPTDYGLHRVAFFQDPNGIFIEIENPVWDDVADRWRSDRQTVVGRTV